MIVAYSFANANLLMLMLMSDDPPGHDIHTDSCGNAHAQLIDSCARALRLAPIILCHCRASALERLFSV